MAPTDFCIVIPTYRRGPLLRRVLPSYLATGGREVILVDDASGPPHDGILVDLARSPGVRLISMTEHAGQPAAKNRAVGEAVSEWIVFGEDDVWFTPGYPRTLIDHARRSEAQVAAGAIPLVPPGLLDGPAATLEAAIRAGSTPGRDPDRFLGLPWPVERLPHGDVVTPHLTACAAVHRSVFDRVRFDPRYRGNAFREETDFFLSCEELGIRTIFCPHAASGHVKEHTRAAPGGSWTMGRGRYAIHLFTNNWRFVTKHREALGRAARAAGVPGGSVRMQLRFLREQLGRIRPIRA